MINTQYMFDVTFLVVVACVICSWHFRFSISNDWLRWMARSTKATGRMVGSTTRVSYDCQMVLAMILGREEQQQPSVKYFKNHGNGSRSQFIFHSPLFVQKKRNTLDMIYIYIHNLEYVCNIDIMYISYIVHGKQPQRILLMEKTIQWKKNEPSKHHFNWKNPSFEGRPLAPWPGTWPWHRDLSSASPKTIFHGWKVLSQGSFVCWMLIRWSSFKEI